VPKGEPGARCVGVWVAYATAAGDVQALRDVDALFAPGSVTAAAGPSGSGKSTLLRLVAAIDRATAGVVYLDDLEIGRLPARRRRELRRRRIGYVGSHANGSLMPGLTLDEELALVAALRGVQGRRWREDALARLDAVGMGGRGRDRVALMSGGEQQRAAVVAAMVGDPPLLIVDEPTAALDSTTAAPLLDELRSAAAGGTTVVVATHDPLVLEASDVVIHLDSGEVTSAW